VDPVGAFVFLILSIVAMCLLSLLDADPVLGEFFVKYSNKANTLGVNGNNLYKALLANAEVQPHNWNLQGRQADVWKDLGQLAFCSSSTR
jgi:hypothetical protein